MNDSTFDGMIARIAETDDTRERERIRREVWDRWGRRGAVFVTDMASFTRTVRYKGVCYFLAMIHRARSVLDPVIEAHGGRVLKHETDNAFAFFPDAADAIRAALEVSEALRRDGEDRPPDERIRLGIGIDWGEVLVVDDRDYFGDPVNTASKLGEDLADDRELFVTERAVEASGLRLDGVVRREVLISDVTIRYVEVPIRA